MPFLIALFASVFLLGNKTAPSAQYYVNVPYESTEQITELVRKGFDLGGVDHKNKTASFIVRDSEIRQFKVFQDLPKVRITSPDSEYKTYEKMVAILKNTETKYPNLAHVEVIGKSVEGRDIYAIQLTNKKTTGNKRAVLFDAAHHAREVMTMEVATDIIQYLTENYAKEARVQNWLDKYQVWIVPIVNPDGNNKIWTQDSMWRKNTRGGHGVDINRNYSYDWSACNGSSSNKNAQDYHGEKAMSEPETVALTGLASKIKPKFDISYHSYSELVIYPFGCSPKQVENPDGDLYRKVGKTLASKLISDDGKGSYDPGTAYELLYDVDGGSIDWMYKNTRTMAFVIEVNSTSQGFQPSYQKWREATVVKQREGWQYILDQMDGPELP